VCVWQETASALVMLRQLLERLAALLVQFPLDAVPDIVAFHDDALARAQQVDYRFNLLVLERNNYRTTPSTPPPNMEPVRHARGRDESILGIPMGPVGIQLEWE